MPEDTPATERLLRRVWSVSAVRYLVVGGFAFVFDVALLFMLHDVLGIGLAISTPLAFLASFVVTYTLQRTIAFRSDDNIAPSVIRYAALVAFNTVATTAIVWGWDTLGGPWLFGKIFAVVVTTVWNYFAYRYWVFAPQKMRS